MSYKALRYPTYDYVASAALRDHQTMKVCFIPFKMKPALEGIDNFREMNKEWKPPQIKESSDGVESLVDRGGLFNFEVPVDSKYTITLPLPSSSLNDANNHNWNTSNLTGDLQSKFLGNGFIKAAVGTVLPPVFITNYQSSGVRNFVWNFHFIPQSQSEAKMVMKIIHVFKTWSAPGSGKDIGVIEPYIVTPAILPESCALAIMLKLLPGTIRSVNVTYFDNGQVVTYKDGMPKSILLSLSIEEMFVHTRQTMGQGGWIDAAFK